MKPIKAVIIVVLILLVFVAIMQNTQVVETKLLLLTFSMPKALLIIITLLIGFVLGAVTTKLLNKNPLMREEWMGKNHEDKKHD